ncbi:polysaccharide biosynthesis/export family protein [Flavobacterium sp.]|uniref:polysaccharide biosynthesis/export family protein n=1 Tax=Flavobacterium sp. TaxID=239 RepID=UPI00261F200A|nr:polysaccharide biosynthesis/export family protein [Flavobacterium sp.]MDD2985948.1 polysaccharide biosynthesis/export family protein [Flavobacterium sp.]
MNKSVLFILVIITMVFTSCVPTKDLTYLQDGGKVYDSIMVNQSVKKPYRVQSNDILMVNIKTSDPVLNTMFKPSDRTQNVSNEQVLFFEGFTVDDHGLIRIPVLGEIPVIGKTTEEIRIDIEKKLGEDYFKKEANIFVNVKLAGLRYTINGEVKIPGTNTLFVENATIMDAISNSGDITIIGDRKNVMVVRRYPHGVEMHSINLLDKKALESPYYYLQPNDFILVNPLKQKSWGTGTTGLQSLTTIISVLSLATTIIVLTRL